MSFIDSNIPSNIFYGAIFSDHTLKFEHLKPRLESLLRKMIKQGATKCFICKQINKGFIRYPEEFQKFGINVQDFKLSLGIHN